MLKKFDFDNMDQLNVLPGHALRPGIPAPSDARLSFGLQPATPSRPGKTTTVRLVSDPLSMEHVHLGKTADHQTPQLKPFSTSYDLILESPTTTAPWPFDKPSSIPAREPDSANGAGSHISENFATQQAARPLFVFGSPDPKHRISDVQFGAAAHSVLEEMNRRLKEEGVEVIPESIMDNKPGNTGKLGTAITPDARAKPRDTQNVRAKFDKLHQEQFQKMEGIDSYLERKGTQKAASQSLLQSDVVQTGVKRKSDNLSDRSNPRLPGAGMQRSAAQTRVISNGRRKGAMPGAFSDSEDEDVEPEPKKPRINFNVSEGPDAEIEGEALRIAKGKEAIKKKLDANRAARRRSSGIHGPRHSAGRRISRGSTLRRFCILSFVCCLNTICRQA
jgi:hypothetical protein